MRAMRKRSRMRLCASAQQVPANAMTAAPLPRGRAGVGAKGAHRSPHRRRPGVRSTRWPPRPVPPRRRGQVGGPQWTDGCSSGPWLAASSPRRSPSRRNRWGGCEIRPLAGICSAPASSHRERENMTRLLKRLLPDWIKKQLRERLRAETRSVLDANGILAPCTPRPPIRGMAHG